jgi:hypothetical protein
MVNVRGGPGAAGESAPAKSRQALLALKGRRPVATGASRVVHQHPHDPDLLVKTMRPDFLAGRRVNTRWSHRFKRARIFSIFVREISEQLVLIGKGEEPRAFLQWIVGFEETDLGLGMVVEALRAPDGKLAPSLHRVVARKEFDKAARRDLERFCAAILESNVILGALNPRNILYAVDPAGGRRFVLIDGFGEGALIPLMGIFPAWSRRAKRKHVRRLRKWLAEQAGPRLTAP